MRVQLYDRKSEVRVNRKEGLQLRGVDRSTTSNERAK
jgi:hypothetical protein